MTPSESTLLIDRAGGNTAFAELLGLTGQAGYKQRVCNWRRRGIPPAVILEHHDTIRKLQAQPAKSNRAA